jgi:hypothetical protein
LPREEDGEALTETLSVALMLQLLVSETSLVATDSGVAKEAPA